jgi:hypothetical protein
MKRQGPNQIVQNTIIDLDKELLYLLAPVTVSHHHKQSATPADDV